jgi:hypothetical protein
MVHQ